MFWFVFLALLLVVTTAVLIAVPFINKKMTFDKFNNLCTKKVQNFAKRNNLLALSGLKIVNYNSDTVRVNHIIFGKKYIYLISDFLLKGFVEGETDDTSWTYFSKVTKKTSYVANLNKLAKDNINDFSSLLGIGPEPFVAISVVPNNCDFKIKNKNDKSNYFCHFYSLNKIIRGLERANIGSLDERQIYEQYETIKQRNSEGNI